jgi:mono/diheme cytochrome c family protein
MATRLLLLLLNLALLPVTGAAEPAEPAEPTEPAYPRARPLTDRTFEVTAGRVERGRYLAEHLLQCFVCHSERDWDAPGAPPIAGRKGAGVVMSERDERRIVAPNITPDVATGAGSWTDDMLARAIREGIGHDGRALYPGMWYRSFASLSDEDLAAVVVYLRTLPPVRNVLPSTVLPDEERIANARSPRPITEPVPGPLAGDTKALGRYLLGVADCAGCHTAWEAPRNPGLFGGGNDVGRGSRTAFSANLTRHETGVAYPRETFISVMHTGKGGSLHPIMPWMAFSGLTDADLGAMYDALGDVYPVAHYIGNTGEPRHCDVCGQEHPFGEHNRVVLPQSVPVAEAVLEGLTGTYRSEEFDWTIEVRRVADKLYARENDSTAAIELFALTETRYLGSGLLTPIEFRLPVDGAATRLVALELEEIVLERVH